MDIIARNMNVTKWGAVPGESFFLQQRYLANIGPPPHPSPFPFRRCFVSSFQWAG